MWMKELLAPNTCFARPQPLTVPEMGEYTNQPSQLRSLLTILLCRYPKGLSTSPNLSLQQQTDRDVTKLVLPIYFVGRSQMPFA